MAEVNKIKKVKKDEKRLTDNWGYYMALPFEKKLVGANGFGGRIIFEPQPW